MLGAFGLLAFTQHAASADTNRTIKIAVILPYTGTAGETMGDIDRAIQLAVDQANGQGLPGGYRIELRRCDHGVAGKAYDEPRAQDCMRQIIGDPLVVAEYGPFHSAVTSGMIRLSNAAGLAMVSQVTFPGLTRGSTGLGLRSARPDDLAFFRMSGTNDLQGPAGAQFARAQGIKRIYVLDDAESYGKSLADTFEISFRAAGGEVIAHEAIGNVAGTYPAVVERVSKAKPDAVYFGGLGPQLAAFRLAMAAAGLGKLPFYGGNAMGEDNYAKDAHGYLYNSFYTFTAPNAAHVPGPLAQRFVNDFQRRWHRAPGQFDIGAYASLQVEIAALRTTLTESRGAFPSRAAVRAAIERTHHLQTSVGETSFDVNGDIRKPYISFYGYGKDGRPHYVTQAIVQRQ